MSQEGSYGRKLTREEYDKAVVRLHEGLPPRPSKELARRTRRRELDCFVDYCFGIDFPAERREELWRVRTRIDRRFPWLIMKYAFSKLFGRSMASDLVGLTGFVYSEYSQVLNPTELRTFMDLEEGGTPILPSSVQPSE